MWLFLLIIMVYIFEQKIKRLFDLEDEQVEEASLNLREYFSVVSEIISKQETASEDLEEKGGEEE